MRSAADLAGAKWETRASGTGDCSIPGPANLRTPALIAFESYGAQVPISTRSSTDWLRDPPRRLPLPSPRLPSSRRLCAPRLSVSPSRLG
jgi:hypothetical protein